VTTRPVAERTASPILGDVAEQAMLDLVPFARAGREVRDVDAQAQKDEARRI
jgi:hypothetical protein